MKSIIHYPLLFLLIGCNSNVHDGEKSSLYIDVINQLIDDRYCESCSEVDGLISKKYDELSTGKIDTITYFTTVDRLTSPDNRPMRCLLEYSEGLYYFRRNVDPDSSVRTYITENLNDAFFNNHFGSIAKTIVADTLSFGASLTFNDVTSRCMEITPYVRNPDNPYKNGIGVVGFSKAFYNDKRNAAVIYYEFMCGRSCGRGEVMFLQKEPTRWKIVKSKNIWSS